MATFLSKLFKPKWQSKHIETRKEALASLDEFKAEDLSILTQLAETDPSSEIQHLAIQKISDSSTLISLHKKAKDTFKEALEKRLYELASAQSLSIFDLILDQDLLTEMITKATQADSYIRGLARIESSEVLLKIATQSRNAQIRQAAAELIESEKELNELFAHAKNKDKTVFHIAKNKLAELRALAQRKSEQQEQVAKLLKDLESLSKTEALQHFDARLGHIQKQWLTVKGFSNEEQNSRFDALLVQCEEKLDKLNNANQSKQNEKAEPTATEQTQEANDEIEATLSAINDTLKRFQVQTANSAEISALDALIKTQENRWIEATKEVDVNKSHQKKYTDGMLQLRHYLKAIRHFIEKQETLSATITSLQEDKDLSPFQLEQQRKKLGQLIRNIDWPNAFSQPDLIQEAHKALELSKERKQALVEKQKLIEDNIHRQIEKMDISLEEKQIKAAVQDLKSIQSNLGKLDKKQADKFQQGLALRINQLNELRDWQGFASTPKQQDLCEAMERLAETHIDPNDKADKIKKMQQEWKSLGGTGDQALWQRFKTASDKAFEPCALFFAEQKQLKEANLNKRQTLVEQLKAYTASIEWDQVSSQNSHPSWSVSDWKAAIKINRQARQEWKDAFPVDFKASKTLQAEFNQLMDTFDAQLENERQYNLALKQAVVDKAQALVESEDIEASIQAVKSLQDEWQKIGITHHKADRKLWSEYRAACDAIFERRNQERETKRSELDQVIKTATETCQAIEANCQDLATKTKDELKTMLGEHKKAMQAMTGLPHKVQEKLNQRIQAVNENIHNVIKQKDKDIQKAIWLEVARKATILRQAYSTIVLDNATNKEELAATLGEQFNSQVTLPSQLEAKFLSNWEAVKEGQIDKLNIINEQQARELCIASEIAAGLESPESDKALRMQLQVSRLSEGLSSGNESISREAQLESVLSAWYLALGLDSAVLEDLQPRIEASKDLLLGE